MLLLGLSAVWLVEVPGSPSADAVLEPADWPAVLEGWGEFIGDSEHPLSMVTADGNTIEACFDAVLHPYGECVIVFLDQESRTAWIRPAGGSGDRSGTNGLPGNGET